jgi:hypothetical protein
MFTLATIEYTVEIRDAKSGRAIVTCDDLNTAMVNVFKDNLVGRGNYKIAIITGETVKEWTLDVRTDSNWDCIDTYTFTLGKKIKCSWSDYSDDLKWESPRKLEWMPHYIIELLTP